MLVTGGAAALSATLACALALVSPAAGAMPGLAPTPGFGVPTQAALSGETWEHCSDGSGSDTSPSFVFNPVSLEGCKAKCLELYPAVGAAEFNTDSLCCCQGLTTAQVAEMNWCHYPNSKSQAYYFKACTQAEPTACISDDSLSSEQKLAIYTGGTYECTAPAPPPAAYAVTMAVTLDASISDVTDSVLVAMRQKVADEAGVPLDAVTVTTSAGSVLVAFTIHLQSEAAADTALSAVGAQLADTTAASAFLSTASLTVTVAEISEAPAKVVLLSPPPSAPPPSPAPAPPPPSSGGVPVAAIGGAVGGAVVLLLLIGAVLVYMMKRKNGRVYVAEANVKNAGPPILATPPQGDAVQSK